MVSRSSTRQSVTSRSPALPVRRPVSEGLRPGQCNTLSCAWLDNPVRAFFFLAGAPGNTPGRAFHLAERNDSHGQCVAFKGVRVGDPESWTFFKATPCKRNTAANAYASSVES